MVEVGDECFARRAGIEPGDAVGTDIDVELGASGPTPYQVAGCSVAIGIDPEGRVGTDRLGAFERDDKIVGIDPAIKLIALDTCLRALKALILGPFGQQPIKTRRLRFGQRVSASAVVGRKKHRVVDVGQNLHRLDPAQIEPGHGKFNAHSTRSDGKVDLGDECFTRRAGIEPGDAVGIDMDIELGACRRSEYLVAGGGIAVGVEPEGRSRCDRLGTREREYEMIGFNPAVHCVTFDQRRLGIETLIFGPLGQQPVKCAVGHLGNEIPAVGI